MTRSQVIGLLPAFCFVASPGLAQGPPDLVTDRPDQTESAVVVPSGTVQIESGALFARRGDGAERLETAEIGGTLVRFALGERIEARVAWAGDVRVRTRSGARSGTIRGSSDPELGAKGSLLAIERGDGMDLALLAHLTLPVGSAAYGSPRADPSLRLLGAHAVGGRVGVGRNVGCEWESVALGDATRTRSRFVYTVSVAADLAPRWGAFVELFGDLPASDGGSAAHAFDGGITFAATPRLQFDLAAGTGLSGDGDDFFVGVGLAIRLPR